jgi:hypothetical protein
LVLLGRCSSLTGQHGQRDGGCSRQGEYEEGSGCKFAEHDGGRGGERANSVQRLSVSIRPAEDKVKRRHQLYGNERSAEIATETATGSKQGPGMRETEGKKRKSRIS